MKEIITNIILIVLLFVGFIYALYISLSRNDAMWCEKWKQQSEEYAGFYWTESQIEQCKK